jgi:hypothetical protein
MSNATILPPLTVTPATTVPDPLWVIGLDAHRPAWIRSNRLGVNAQMAKRVHKAEWARARAAGSSRG